MEAAPLSAFGVGSYFIQQYYRILRESPDVAYQFYNNESTVTRVENDEEELTASTILDIHSVLMSLNYIAIEIFKLKCQDSLNGGILAIVSGSVKSRNFSGRRNFSQVFFLAPQKQGYFVLNDIFEYTDEAPVYQQPSLPEVPETKVDSELHTSTYTEEPVSSYALEQEAREYIDSVHVEEDYPVDQYSPPAEQQPEEYGAETVVEEAPVKESPLHDGHASVVQDIKPVPANEPVGEPTRFTYASILRSKGAAAPQRVKQTAPPPEYQKVQTTAPPSHPSASSFVSEADDGSAQEEGEPTSVYVRNLPSDVTIEELEREFKHFGKIKPNGIFIRNRKEVGVCFGFVEFEELSSVHNAVQASPINLDGNRIYVEERRASSTGVSRGGGRGRGRGRGSYNRY